MSAKQIPVDSFEELHAPVGTMSYPLNGEFDSRVHSVHATVVVCADTECQERAAGYIQQATGHRGEFEEFKTKTATDQRVCVTCGQPIRPVSATRFEHAGHLVDGTPITIGHDHRAQPKLAHPMDLDPFAGSDI